MRTTAISLLVGTLVAATVVGVIPAGAATQVPLPTVTGPIAGTPFTSAPVPLSGYAEQEFFVSGTATGYQRAGTWGTDGHWAVTPAEQAPYNTRIVVRRPTDPARFSGTVIVEWLNVSSGVDLDPDFLYTNAEVLRAGDAWVGVSAQAGGVNALRALLPARYATLRHPGDTFSYSVFSQAARAVVDGGVLGGLRPKTMLAAGESQSAFRMVTYADAIQPVDGLFDGFLIHSRSANAAPISQAPQVSQPAPALADDRTDLRQPVLDVQTETDMLAPNLDYAQLNQPDSAKFRLWEIAGTSHVGTEELALFGAEVAPFVPSPPVFPCGRPPNTDQESAVMDAALAQLTRWVRFDVPAGHADRIAVANGAIVRDADGNALGGVRPPAQQVPTATHNGNDNTGPAFPCALYGTTTPFGPAELAARYPTRGRYVAEVAGAAVADTIRGFLLPADAGRIVSDAAKAPIPPA